MRRRSSSFSAKRAYARRAGQRELSLGLSPDDAAAQWLREHDRSGKPAPAKKRHTRRRRRNQAWK